MGEAQRVTAVVVTYNSASCIEACIRSLATHLSDAEIVVVDNASTDETATLLESLPHGVHVIRNEANTGYGTACNIGVSSARGSHVLLLNPDVVVTRADDLAPLLSKRPFGLAAPAIEQEKGNAAPSIRTVCSPRQEYWKATWQTLVPPFLTRERPYASRASKGWASGAILLVRRDEFLALGGFDSRFFLYYEDVDLSMRYHAGGFTVWGIDVLTAAHVGGASSGDDTDRTPCTVANLLGLIEFLCLHDSDAAGRYGKKLLSTYRRIERTAYWIQVLLNNARSERKLGQVRAVLGMLEELQDAGAYTVDGTAYFEEAVRILRGSSGAAEGDDVEVREVG